MFDAGRYPKDDFDLRAGRDSIPQVETPPDTFSGGGLPAGGTANQVLTKIDGTDFNADWEDPAGGVSYRELTSALSVAGVVPTTTEINTALAAAYSALTPADGDFVILTVSSAPKFVARVSTHAVTANGVFVRSFTVDALTYYATLHQCGIF